VRRQARTKRSATMSLAAMLRSFTVCRRLSCPTAGPPRSPPLPRPSFSTTPPRRPPPAALPGKRDIRRYTLSARFQRLLIFTLSIFSPPPLAAFEHHFRDADIFFAITFIRHATAIVSLDISIFTPRPPPDYLRHIDAFASSVFHF